jgi:hypothetical protein
MSCDVNNNMWKPFTCLMLAAGLWLMPFDMPLNLVVFRQADRGSRAAGCLFALEVFHLLFLDIFFCIRHATHWRA